MLPGRPQPASTCWPSRVPTCCTSGSGGGYRGTRASTSTTCSRSPATRGGSPTCSARLPTGEATDPETRLAGLVDTEVSVAESDLRTIRQLRPETRTARMGPDEYLETTAEALVGYWREVLAPLLCNVYGFDGIVAADIAHHRAALASQGLGAALPGMHEELSFVGQTVRVAMHTDAVVQASGRGVWFVPSVFRWPWISVDIREREPVVSYAARGAGRVWEDDQQSDLGLVELLGRSRAEILRRLDVPRSTTGLARDLELSPSTVSWHLFGDVHVGAAGVAPGRPPGPLHPHSRRRPAGPRRIGAGADRLIPQSSSRRFPRSTRSPSCRAQLHHRGHRLLLVALAIYILGSPRGDGSRRGVRGLAWVALVPSVVLLVSWWSTRARRSSCWPAAVDDLDGERGDRREPAIAEERGRREPPPHFEVPPWCWAWPLPRRGACRGRPGSGDRWLADDAQGLLVDDATQRGRVPRARRAVHGAHEEAALSCTPSGAGGRAEGFSLHRLGGGMDDWPGDQPFRHEGPRPAPAWSGG